MLAACWIKQMQQGFLLKIQCKTKRKPVMAQKSLKRLETKMQQGQWTDGWRKIRNGEKFIGHKFQSGKDQSQKEIIQEWLPFLLPHEWLTEYGSFLATELNKACESWGNKPGSMFPLGLFGDGVPIQGRMNQSTLDFLLWTWLGHQHLPNSEYPLFAWMQNTVQAGQHVWQLARSSHGACKAWEKANSQANARMALIGMSVKTKLEPGKLAYQCLGRQHWCKWGEIGTGIVSGMVHLNTMNWRECAGCAKPNLIPGENWAHVQIPGPRKAWTRLNI